MAYRYFLQCSFKGTTFNGWQVQLNAPSVQEALEKGFSTLLRTKIELTGAGRTDTGVHAKRYFAHFELENPFIDKKDFLYRLNRVIPYEIAVQQIFEVKESAHARFDALSRSYEYQIITEKDPFEKDYCWYISVPLDLEIMNDACSILKENTDFSSFCKLHSDNKTNICHIAHAYWLQQGNLIIFHIKADRFLRNMVRAIVGTMVEIGLGKITLEDFKLIIDSKNRNKAGCSAPAQGLFFTDAEYPEDIWLDKQNKESLL